MAITGAYSPTIYTLIAFFGILQESPDSKYKFKYGSLQNSVRSAFPKAGSYGSFFCFTNPGISSNIMGKGIASHSENKADRYRSINSGDISGIMCTVEQSGKSVLACSLTHLTFEPTFPLCKEVIHYQKKRVKRIEELQRIHTAYPNPGN